jgi:enolase
MMNIIDAKSLAENDLSFQEFMGIPTGFKTFRDTLRCCARTYHGLWARLDVKVSEGKDSWQLEPGVNTELADDTMVIVLVAVDYSEIKTSEFQV